MSSGFESIAKWLLMSKYVSNDDIENDYLNKYLEIIDMTEEDVLEELEHYLDDDMAKHVIDASKINPDDRCVCHICDVENVLTYIQQQLRQDPEYEASQVIVDILENIDFMAETYACPHNITCQDRLMVKCEHAQQLNLMHPATKEYIPYHLVSEDKTRVTIKRGNVMTSGSNIFSVGHNSVKQKMDMFLEVTLLDNTEFWSPIGTVVEMERGTKMYMEPGSKIYVMPNTCVKLIGTSGEMYTGTEMCMENSIFFVEL